MLMEVYFYMYCRLQSIKILYKLNFHEAYSYIPTYCIHVLLRYSTMLNQCDCNQCLVWALLSSCDESSCWRMCSGCRQLKIVLKVSVEYKWKHSIFYGNVCTFITGRTGEISVALPLYCKEFYFIFQMCNMKLI